MLQKKDLLLDQCGIKFASGRDALRFSGYASVFNGVDDYGDTVAPGAFARALKERGSKRIKMLFGHMRNIVIGKWTQLRVDDKGLFVEGELTPNHSDAANVAASMKHGAVDALSIGYYVYPNGEIEDE